MAEKIIEVKNLHKSYGDVHAVKGIDFYVESGKLFAFLGPNGAGKSTTIDILCTFLEPDSGEVRIDGQNLNRDNHAIRSSIGVVFQDGILDPLLTVEDNLKIRGGFYKLKGSRLKAAINRVSEQTNITELLKRPYGKLSGGQRRRCDIARALINTPKILFMDEPTTGLDPQTRQNVWETVRKLQEQTQMTIFLTTHYMEEAATADYVIVIDNGEIAAKGTPAELKERYTSDKLILECKDVINTYNQLKELNIECQRKGNCVFVKLLSSMDSLEIIEKCKNDITGFEVLKGTMDDAFIAVTGKELRE